MQRLSLSCRDVHTYSGLSQAFFGLATMPLAFERMCSQPITSPLVSAALSLLGCGFDQARKRVRWEDWEEGARGHQLPTCKDGASSCAQAVIVAV